jgi:hypothetical protein
MAKDSVLTKSGICWNCGGIWLFPDYSKPHGESVIGISEIRYFFTDFSISARFAATAAGFANSAKPIPASEGIAKRIPRLLKRRAEWPIPGFI